MSIDTHRAVEFVAATILALLPIGVAVAGGETPSDVSIVVCIVLGIVMATLALSGGRDRAALNATDHRAADRMLSVVLVVAAIVFWVAGDGVPALACVFAAAVEIALTLLTRYVAGPSGRGGGPPAVTA